jgi:hypothetical protein
MGQGVYTKFWLGNIFGKSPLGSLRKRWKNNIKFNLMNVDCDGGDEWNWLGIEFNDGRSN